jgi:enoyl-CoA hydratase
VGNLVVLDHPRPHVARVTLNRPDRLNAMSIELVLELDTVLRGVGDENDTWVIVLTGAGRAFSSGLDLKDYGIIPNVDGLTVGRIAQRSMRAYSQVVLTMRRVHQPVVAAIAGPAFGGGMCLALAADVRVASESAVFNATGIVNGLTSTEMAAAWLLPRLIGAAHANDLLLTGRRIDAEEAARLGLVSRVVPDNDLETVALDLAADMCRFSPYGLSMTKNALWAAHEIGSLEAAIEFEDRNQLLLGFTENLQEAIRAFDEGRQPVYSDEPRRDVFDPRS